MQAHPLSFSAARNQHAPSGPSVLTQRHSLQPIPINIRSSCAEHSGIAQTSGLAHDADNLLAALGLYSDLLARPGVLQPEHSHYATELHDLAERGSRLMRSLIPHIPAGITAEKHTFRATHLEPTPIDPALALNDLAPLLHAIAAPYANVTIATGNVPLVTFSAQDFERILVNLVRNAAQAIERVRTPQEPGSIGIALLRHEAQLTLTVEDDGPGMPVIAAAAFLSPSPLPPGASRGLGHRIVHELVTATGGTLSVRVRPGRGTCFVITWPTQTTCTGPTTSTASLASTGFQEVPAC